MPKRILYYGPFNNSQRQDLIEKARTYLKENNGDKFYYILPNGKLLIKYRNILLEECHGAFDVNLFTFDDIVNSLLKKELYTTIGSEAKFSIIKKIIEQLNEDGKIVYYKNVFNMDGFIENVSSFIGETKRSLISPKKFNENIPTSPLYEEVGLVYSEYQKFLNENRFLDVEEFFFKGLELLKNRDDYFKGLDFIVIDEFFDFRPQEVQVLREIIKYPIDVYINIPYKRDVDFQTVTETLTLLKDMGFQIVEIEKKGENLYETIGDKLFTEAYLELSKPDNIKIIKAPNKYLELKRISQEIKCLYKKGIPLKEIGLALTTPNEYVKIMFEVFNEEQIPCSINEEMGLIDVPLIKELLTIIDFKINNYDKKSTINRVKNNYFSIYSDKDKDKIEYILYKLNYNEIKELQNIIAEEKNNIEKVLELEGEEEIVKEKYEQLNYLEKSLEKMIKEGDSIPEISSLENMVESILNIVENYDLKGKILSIYDMIKDYDIFYRDISALSKLKEILERMNTSLSIVYEEINIVEFYDIFKKYLETETIVTTLGNHEGVNILTPSTMQGINYEVLFVAGLVEGKYPNLRETNFLLKEENIPVLKKIGFDIKSYEEKLDKESLLFTIGVTRCTKYLYLTYPESSLKEEINIPSIFLDEFLSLFKGEKMEDKLDVIQLDMSYLIKDDLNDITTNKELIDHLLYQYYSEENSKQCFNMLSSINGNVLNEINEKIQCEMFRSKNEFNEYNGLIGDEEIKKDLIENQKGLSFSITYFETYGKCPYKFLMDYVLNLKGMERFMEDFTSLDKGNIYHKVLKDYYSYHNKEIVDHIDGKEEFRVEDTIEEIDKSVRRILVKNGVKDINRLWNIRIENMTDTILNLIKSDLDRLSSLPKKMIPWKFEVAFGFEEDFKLNIDGENIKILGKIDRIDKVINEDKYVLYDYKSSSYGIKKIKDMKEGISFQLPVYIMAQEDKNIIAGGYINISKGEISIELLKEDEKEIFKKSRGKYILCENDWNGLMEEIKIKMKEYMNQVYEGNFSINPKVCDEYCSFKEICRYDER